jgi:hypothetical protein
MDSVVCNPNPPNAIVVYGICDNEVSLDERQSESRLGPRSRSLTLWKSAKGLRNVLDQVRRERAWSL